jgi:hypothetical protein
MQMDESFHKDIGTDIIDIIPAVEWMSEGLVTLRKVKAHGKDQEQIQKIYLFIFRCFFIPSFQSILDAGRVTSDEAEIVHEIIADHLDDAVLQALSETEIKPLTDLLAPFVEESSDEPEAVDGVIYPDVWMTEAIETLSSIKAGAKNIEQKAALSKFIFSTYVFEAFLAINTRGSITANEVELVNDILQNYFNDAVFKLLPSEVLEEFKKLLSPFATENGVDATPFLKVA